MHQQLNTPYHPGLCNLAGTYRINVGSLFYIGSTTSYGRRHSQHKCDLEAGTHPNKRLQSEFNATNHFEFITLTKIPRKPHDTGNDHRERLQFNEQILLDQHRDNPNLANSSESARHNSTIGRHFKSLWQNPEFRETQIKRLKARRGDAISAETRQKMSDAKKGAKNINARPCIVNGIKFDTGQAAARHFNVTQQAMDNWLRGATPWPGTGKRQPKPTTAHMIGATGRYL